MDYSKYKAIVVTRNNYDKLKQLGQTGDTFNQIIGELIKRAEQEPEI